GGGPRRRPGERGRAVPLGHPAGAGRRLPGGRRGPRRARDPRRPGRVLRPGRCAPRAHRAHRERRADRRSGRTALRGAARRLRPRPGPRSGPGRRMAYPSGGITTTMTVRTDEASASTVRAVAGATSTRCLTPEEAIPMSEATLTPAKFEVDGSRLEFERVPAREGNDGIRISSLLKETGLVTLDPGFMNTASTESAITYIDGD